MKIIMENWRTFLVEAKKSNFQLYVDMDGVLVNFLGPVINLINNDINNPPSSLTEKAAKTHKKMLADLEKLNKTSITVEDIHVESENGIKSVKNYMYNRIADNVNFWSNLPWLRDGNKLWDFVKDFNPKPIILSSPMNEGSKQGKIIWCKENLNLDPDRIILTSEKYKLANPQALLIDDMPKYYEPFKAAGGYVIVHTSATDTINKLKRIIISD